MHEFSLIEQYFSPLAADDSVGRQLLDDGAVLPCVPGKEWVVVKDVLCEGTHFVAGAPADGVAERLLRSNLSDIAAMGAIPHYYLLGVTVPRGIPEDWFSDFARGLAAAQETFGIRLVGGDTTSHTHNTSIISCTLLGLVDCNQAISRLGASIGADVYVSGRLGKGLIGLEAVQTDSSDAVLLDYFYRPTPRISLIQALRPYVRTCLDISDGLVQDLMHMRCGIDLSLASIPTVDHFSSRLKLINHGDDYELAFTAGRADRACISAKAAEIGEMVTRIGSVVEGDRVRVLDEEGAEIVIDAGYSHF